MKLLIMLTGFFLLNAFCFSGPDELSGVWLTEKGDSKIQIAKINSNWEGKVIWLKDPVNKDGIPKLDKNNPDPLKRKQPIIGLTILSQLSFTDNKFVGKVYSPEKGKTFDCEILLKDGGKLTLKVKAGIFKKEVEWIKQN